MSAPLSISFNSYTVKGILRSSRRVLVLRQKGQVDFENTTTSWAEISALTKSAGDALIFIADDDDDRLLITGAEKHAREILDNPKVEAVDPRVVLNAVATAMVPAKASVARVIFMILVWSWSDA